MKCLVLFVLSVVIGLATSVLVGMLLPPHVFGVATTSIFLVLVGGVLLLYILGNRFHSLKEKLDPTDCLVVGSLCAAEGGIFLAREFSIESGSSIGPLFVIIGAYFLILWQWDNKKFLG